MHIALFKAEDERDTAQGILYNIVWSPPQKKRDDDYSDDSSSYSQSYSTPAPQAPTPPVIEIDGDEIPF